MCSTHDGNTVTKNELRAVVFTTKDNPNIVDQTFSLERTIDQIYTSATNKQPDAQKRAALLETLLSTFRTSSLQNNDSGLTFAFDPRPGESTWLNSTFVWELTKGLEISAFRLPGRFAVR
jgi:hypothetical protein